MTAIAIIFIPESPLYLYAAKDFEKARQSLNIISKFNKSGVIMTELFDIELEEIQEKQAQNKMQ
jgi:hypothetical protein